MGPKTFWIQKNFGFKRILGLKTFWVKKKMLVQIKYFVSKKCMSVLIFFLKDGDGHTLKVSKYR